MWRGSPASPLLVLLEPSMPVLDVHQELERMRADERTRHIPVVIMTTTDDTREVSRRHNRGCNVYVTAPVGHEQASEAVRKVGLFPPVVTRPNWG